MPGERPRPKASTVHRFGDLVSGRLDARPLWRRVDSKAGLSLHQAMLFYGDQHDAQVVSELLLDGFGDPPFMPLHQMPDSARDEYRVHSWRLEDRRRRMQLSFHRLLQAGDVTATGYTPGSAFDMPAVKILPQRWHLLEPDFANSSASGPGGSVVGILVFASGPIDDKNSYTVEAFSSSRLREWYVRYVANNQSKGVMPSRDEDLKNVHIAFGKKIPRAVIRQLRSELAPAEWKSFGRRKSS